MNILKRGEQRREEFLNSLVQLSTLTAPNTSFYLFYRLMSLRPLKAQVKTPYSHLKDTLWLMLYLITVDTKNFARRIPLHFILTLSRTNKIGFVRDSIKTRLLGDLAARTRLIFKINHPKLGVASSRSAGVASLTPTGLTSNFDCQPTYRASRNLSKNSRSQTVIYTSVPQTLSSAVILGASQERSMTNGEIQQRPATSCSRTQAQPTGLPSSLTAQSRKRKKSIDSFGKGIRHSQHGSRMKNGRLEFWVALALTLGAGLRFPN